MLVLALQFSRGQSTRETSTGVDVSIAETIEERRNVHRGNNSLKTEENTTSVSDSLEEVNLNPNGCITDTTVHQQVCPKRIRGTDERFGKHSLERR